MGTLGMVLARCDRVGGSCRIEKPPTQKIGEKSDNTKEIRFFGQFFSNSSAMFCLFFVPIFLIFVPGVDNRQQLTTPLLLQNIGKIKHGTFWAPNALFALFGAKVGRIRPKKKRRLKGRFAKFELGIRLPLTGAKIPKPGKEVFGVKKPHFLPPQKSVFRVKKETLFLECPV